MSTVIGRAVLYSLEVSPELSRVCGLFMVLEGGFLLPDFDDDEMVRPADLLDHIDPQDSAFSTAGFAILLDQRDALTGRIGLDVDISYDKEERVGLGTSGGFKHDQQKRNHGKHASAELNGWQAGKGLATREHARLSPA
jgi:hypothetical protein